MRFIAIDPGSQFTGWAIFQGERLEAWGLIDTRRVDYAHRFPHIVDHLDAIGTRYRITEIAAEAAVRFEGREIAALKVTSNAIKSWARGRRLPFSEYNVATWKKSVVGHGNATKDQVARNIFLRFPELPNDVTEHETDAIAIGTYHSGTRRLERMAAPSG